MHSKLCCILTAMCIVNALFPRKSAVEKSESSNFCSQDKNLQSTCNIQCLQCGPRKLFTLNADITELNTTCTIF